MPHYSVYKAVLKVFWRLAKSAGYRGIAGSTGFPRAEASRLMKKAWWLVGHGQD